MICPTLHCITQCSVFSTIITQCMCLTVHSTFKVQKTYLHLHLPGQWWVKHSFLWDKVHNDCRELPICVNTCVLFSSGGFPTEIKQRTLQSILKQTYIKSLCYDNYCHTIQTPSTAMLCYDNYSQATQLQPRYTNTQYSNDTHYLRFWSVLTFWPLR